MKKILALVLAVVMILALAACGQPAAPAKPGAEGGGEAPKDDAIIKKVALVTDVGTIDDESFNQATWMGVETWSKANNVDHIYYQPTENSTDARTLSITQAIKEGANVIVLPGFLFGPNVLDVQKQYPDVYFLAVDVGEGDLTYDYETYEKPASNVVCLTFAEEQAGYLAGYAAVADGYTKLGFLGGMAVPAVVRYGYGFVQGADAAAQKLSKEVSIEYYYSGVFQGDASITARMEGWYKDGTEVVFACGGGVYTSAVEAALQHNGKVIGVDIDQHYVGEAKDQNGKPLYAYNPFISSAMKQLQNVTEAVLQALQEGNWENYGGKVMTFSLAEGDYVGLPTAEASWGFKNFKLDDYNALVESIKKGEVKVDNNADTTVKPTVSEFTKVNYIA
ncbi:MAG: BMP family ABC transporter substrate-binding protein [Ruminococcaceae bacterium]|nr:BMP family ABC transporter substrate-binding protein [Oscillospiraceae bacterium]